MKRITALLIFLFLASSAAFAQLGLYAGFTTSTLDTANTPRINGGTFGGYFDASHHPLLNFGIDIRGTVLSNNNNPSVHSLTVGPRAVVHLPVIPLRPYAEGLIGEAHVKIGQGVAYSDNSGLDAGFALGADLTILPHIDWRVLDYSYSRIDAAHTYQHSFTTGLVVRIPFT